MTALLAEIQRENQDTRLIPLSALQHYAFCPRQCALIHNKQAWAEKLGISGVLDWVEVDTKTGRLKPV